MTPSTKTNSSTPPTNNEVFAVKMYSKNYTTIEGVFTTSQAAINAVEAKVEQLNDEIDKGNEKLRLRGRTGNCPKWEKTPDKTVWSLNESRYRSGGWIIIQQLELDKPGPHLEL